MKLELGVVKQPSQVTPNRQAWKNKTTSWTSNPELRVPLNAQSYERQEWPLPKVEPPLWILLWLSSVHSFENRVLPTGATNRSGLLSLGRARSRWRDEKAGPSLWYTSVGCGIPRDTEEGIGCSPGIGGWPWWGWGGAVRAEIYHYYLETPSFPLGPDTLCVFWSQVCFFITNTLSVSFSIRTTAKDWG